MAMRGDKLREHILYVAKDVFLEVGFERASMELVASRAATTKRTLYAHFENKESLYFAVIEVVRALFLGKLKKPDDYSADARDALTLYCGRYLEALLFARTIQACRSCIAEAERFPQGSAQYFDVIFTAPQERLRVYLEERFGLSAEASLDAAQRLLGRVIYPRFTRALFGMDPLVDHFEGAAIRADFDLTPVRHAVLELIASLEGLSTNPPLPPNLSE